MLRAPRYVIAVPDLEESARFSPHSVRQSGRGHYRPSRHAAGVVPKRSLKRRVKCGTVLKPLP